MSSSKLSIVDSMQPALQPANNKKEERYASTSINFDLALLKWAKREVSRKGSSFRSVSHVCNQALAAFKEQRRLAALSTRPKYKKV